MKKIKKKIKTDKPQERKLVVGVSLKIDEKSESLWTNGIKQNSLTLQKMFSLLPNVKECKLVNFGKAKNEDLLGGVWEPYIQHIIPYNESLSGPHKCDVVVTAMVSPGPNYIEAANQKGIKIVKQVMGNEYEILSEQVLFEYKGIPQTNFYGRRSGYSANWISPHFYDQCKDLMETIADCPSSIGPYIWDNVFIEHSAKNLAKTYKVDNILYSPSGKQEKRISTFEPNINLVKTCITPALAMNRMYLKAPELIEKAKLFCTDRIKNKQIFIEFIKGLEIYADSKMTVESRFPMTLSLYKFTDIVIAHQRNLDLNYAYFDAAWLGYPIVHNSRTLEGLGYYYNGWDANEASNKLIEVANNFDSVYEEYRKSSREYISRFLPDHKDNIEGYAKLFEDLFK